jgi:hypothetical protein
MMTMQAEQKNNVPEQTQKHRTAVLSPYPSIFTDIFKDEVNLAIWNQALSSEVIRCAERLLEQQPRIKMVIAVSPENCYEKLSETLGVSEKEHPLCQHISLLVDMFCTLFNLKGAGLRLMALDRPMCPKFHVDKIPCRLVTTYIGTATQWLNNGKIDRTKLGAGSLGLTDELSGLFQHSDAIEHFCAGDVGLLKGEGWFDNNNAGLVHRSPHLENNESRLLLTLDYIN